jgi:hypothetical protein
MMQKRDQFALTRFLHNSLQPVDLFRIKRVIGMGSIESDQKPMGVLNGKVARRLFEFRKGRIEICVAAGVYFVITVERAADLAVRGCVVGKLDEETRQASPSLLIAVAAEATCSPSPTPRHPTVAACAKAAPTR